MVYIPLDKTYIVKYGICQGYSRLRYIKNIPSFRAYRSNPEHTMKTPAVYIMTNKRNGTLYTGVTANLPKRVHEHKQQITEGFTKKYNCTLLVYFEICSNMSNAITREKQIKAGSRIYKLGLIEGENPYWRDLYEEII